MFIIIGADYGIIFRIGPVKYQSTDKKEKKSASEGYANQVECCSFIRIVSSSCNGADVEQTRLRKKQTFGGGNLVNWFNCEEPTFNKSNKPTKKKFLSISSGPQLVLNIHHVFVSIVCHHLHHL